MSRFFLRRGKQYPQEDTDLIPLHLATDNAMSLFDSHVQVGDYFGLTMFDHTTSVIVPLQEVVSDTHKIELRAKIDSVRQGRDPDGGTDIFKALLSIMDEVEDNE